MATISRNLRFDEQLWMELQEMAQKDKRSVNSYIALQLQGIVDISKLPPDAKPDENMPDWKKQILLRRQQKIK